MIRLSVERVVGLEKPCCDPPCPEDQCEGNMEPLGLTESQMFNGTMRLMRCKECGKKRWYREHMAYELLPDNLEF